MADSEGRDAETRLTLLESGRSIDDGELAQLYEYPDQPDRVWVRSNFISSIDGGATADGTTSAMGGPGDKLIFNLLRELADVVLVGAGTARTENYSGAHSSVAQRQRRQARGQGEVPQLALVTNSGHLDRDMGVFTRTEVQPLVCTSTASCDDTRHRLAGLAEVVDCSGPDRTKVDDATLLAALRERGMRRILTEGGPMLHGSLIQSDLLDELCLTIAPFIVGGQARRIATGEGQLQTRMRRTHILADDAGFLYTRYVKA
jgi:riboflavin biosynthesis pyrimidine reductase